MAKIKREIAYKLPLSEIAKGEYFKEEGEFGLNYIITKSGFKASRVNVWGNVVRKYESESDFKSITLDDFTATIDVNVFKETLSLFDNIGLGNTVAVIGKIRKGNDRLYIIAESVRLLKPNEELVKRLENIKSLKELQRAIDEEKGLEEIEKKEEENSGEEKVEVEKAIVGD